MEIGSRSNGDRGAMSQINVTPLVDVMLVLLVIFMVTAPMMQQGVQVNLPKAETKALPSQEETVVVSIERSGRMFINTQSRLDACAVLPGHADIHPSLLARQVR